MTIPAIVFFAILMGVGGLAVDLQRVYGVHGQMLAYVDDAALAGAAELDGQSTALTRAIKAACGAPCGGAVGPLVAGSAAFPATALSVQRITFLSALGPADPDSLAPIPAAGSPTAPGDQILCWYTPGFAACVPGETLASAGAKAKFIEVIAAPRTVSYVVLPIANVFSQVFATGQLQAVVQLRATAGFRRAICNNVPLMVCNPNEAINGAGADFTAAGWNGKQIAAKIQGSGAGWTPGNFGLTDNFPGTGANQMEEAMANVNSGAACTEDAIQAKNGANTGKVSSGMNVRFDVYLADMQNSNTDAQYPPAPNVVKGEKPKNGNACNPQQSATSMPLPRDNCFMVAPTPGAGTGCTNYGGVPRFGDGNWARAAYWNTNHPMVPWPPAGLSNTSTRYEVYRYEIEHPEQVALPGDEQGVRACSTVPTDTNRDRDRRVIYVAVVNCIEHGPMGDDTLGKGNVPVKAYAKAFITEPVGNVDWGGGSRTSGGITIKWPTIQNDDFMVEVFDVVKPNDQSGHLHVYPVLYR
jgi:hypothetical protein